jgi:CMP-N-acetylneuraminic acid synthetase
VRISNKNLEPVGGTPLVGRAVEQSLSAERVDTTVVSTDDDEIASVAREHGAEVPFTRPADLAGDAVESAAVVEHALSWFESAGSSFDRVAMLMPTTPFRTAVDINGTLSTLVERDAAAAISVGAYWTPPQWAVSIDAEGRLQEQFEEGHLWTGPDESVPRSQALEPLYAPNGAVFTAAVETFRQYEGFYTPDTVGFEMPSIRSVDIDTPEDLRLARAIANSTEETS